MFTIRKIGVLVSIFCLLILLPSIPQLAADTLSAPGRYCFSLSQTFGIISGQSEELVYYPGRNQYLSLLLWDLKPLLYIGYNANFGPRSPFQDNGFTGNASVKIGLSRDVGIIEDRDWYNPNQNYLTHYSRHEADSQGAILVDLTGGYSWRLSDSFVLGAYGEFSYMYFSWSAVNGYTQYPPYDASQNYPPWNENYTKDPISGKGIQYMQNWFMFSPGVSFRGRINSVLSMEGHYSFSPLIYCADRDDHLLRNLTFWDFTYLGFYIQLGGGFTFSPAANLDLSLVYSYRYISGTRGSTYEQEGSGFVYQTSTNDSGAGYTAIDVGFIVTIRTRGTD